MSGLAVVADSSPASAVVGGTVVDIDYASTGGSEGVYITHSDGTVEARDGLPHFGDKPGLRAGETVIALSVRPSVDGYWLFTNLGRVIAYGAADFLGDAGVLALAAPMISAIATPDGLGYYIVAEDGGIFTFGTAVFYGSIPQILPGVVLDAEVIGIVPSPTGLGYLLVAADGGIFTFGDAVFYGSVPGVLPGVNLDSQIVAVIAQLAGYLMVAGDGGIFTFGTAAFFGSLGGTGATGIVGVAVKPDNSGYVMVDTQANLSPFGPTTTTSTTTTSTTTTTTAAEPTGWCWPYTYFGGVDDGSLQTEADCDAGVESRNRWRATKPPCTDTNIETRIEGCPQLPSQVVGWCINYVTDSWDLIQRGNCVNRFTTINPATPGWCRHDDSEFGTKEFRTKGECLSGQGEWYGDVEPIILGPTTTTPTEETRWCWSNEVSYPTNPPPTVVRTTGDVCQPELDGRSDNNWTSAYPLLEHWCDGGDFHEQLVPRWACIVYGGIPTNIEPVMGWCAHSDSEFGTYEYRTEATCTDAGGDSWTTIRPSDLGWCSIGFDVTTAWRDEIQGNCPNLFLTIDPATEGWCQHPDDGFDPSPAFFSTRGACAVAFAWWHGAVEPVFVPPPLGVCTYTEGPIGDDGVHQGPVTEAITTAIECSYLDFSTWVAN